MNKLFEKNYEKICSKFAGFQRLTNVKTDSCLNVVLVLHTIRNQLFHINKNIFMCKSICNTFSLAAAPYFTVFITSEILFYLHFVF